MRFKLPTLTDKKLHDDPQHQLIRNMLKPDEARKKSKRSHPLLSFFTPKKFLSGTRFVLFIGDEGTILLHMKNNVVLNRQFVTDTSDQNLDEIRASLQVDTQAPISMIIDNLDQTYVQQTLPPVSAMSVKKLIKRRLDRDFGANDIKNALLLGREKTGRKDWNFLMISIEKSKSISAWLDFVYSLPNRFLGIYLVSIETENILKKLEHAMGVPKTGTGSKWKFFVSHNKVGGFRQVILRNDRIIFTRMAQPIGESTPEVIAGNIEQEMQSTIEYMKRLSFDKASGLDIYIIAGNGIKPVFDQSKFEANNIVLLTPYEMAQYLGIEGATQPTDQFGDVILAASISSSPKHVLTFGTPESKKFDLLYSLSIAERAVGAFIFLGIVGYMLSIGFDLYSQYMQEDELGNGLKQSQAKLENLHTEIKNSGLDIYKTGDTIALYQMLQQKKVSPTAFIAKMHSVIRDPILIKNIDWQVEEKNTPGAPPSKPKVTAVLSLIFTQVRSVEDWRIVSKKLLADLKAVFKGYDISYSNLPSKFSESEKLDITFDTNAQKNDAVNGNEEVKLTIKEP